MKNNQTLKDVAKELGYKVRAIRSGGLNKFGPTHIVTMEQGDLLISFETNVLHGVNYFHIHEVTDFITNRTYRSPRFHKAYISPLVSINGITHIRLKEEQA